jgi:biopolymer transport protein ExbB/TolQ
LIVSFKSASKQWLAIGELSVFAMELSWVVMGVCMLLVLGAGIVLCWQVLKRREAFAAVQSSKAQLKQLQARVYQQEDAIRELTAGLRAEKAHVEQLQRQLEFAQGQARQIKHDS